MKKTVFVLVLCLALLGAATPAFADTVMGSNYAYSTRNGGVYVQGYARVRIFSQISSDGFVSSTTWVDSGRYNVYYIHAGGTLTTTFQSLVLIPVTYSKGMGAAANHTSYVASSASLGIVGPALGASGRVTGTHDFKRYSTSASYRCYTSASAFHN